MARIIQRGRLALRNGPWSWLSPPPAIVGVHCLVTDNVGDRFSPPALYFDFLRDAVPHDLMFMPRRVSQGARVMVFGGGGLLDHPYFTKGWNSVLGVTAAELIAWGLGHNRHGGPGGRHPGFLRHFQLVGVRDSGPDVPSAFDWVPCASCMHAAFDAPAEIVHEVALLLARAVSARGRRPPEAGQQRAGLLEGCAIPRVSRDGRDKQLPWHVLGHFARQESGRPAVLEQVPQLQVSRGTGHTRGLAVGLPPCEGLSPGASGMSCRQPCVCREGPAPTRGAAPLMPLSSRTAWWRLRPRPLDASIRPAGPPPLPVARRSAARAP